MTAFDVQILLLLNSNKSQVTLGALGQAGFSNVHLIDATDSAEQIQAIQSLSAKQNTVLVCQFPACELSYWQLEVLQNHLPLQILLLAKELDQTRALIQSSRLQIMPSSQQLDEVINRCKKLSSRTIEQRPANSHSPHALEALWLSNKAPAPDSKYGINYQLCEQRNLSQLDIETLKNQLIDLLVIDIDLLETCSEAELRNLTKVMPCCLLTHASDTRQLPYLSYQFFGFIVASDDQISHDLYHQFSHYQQLQSNRILLNEYRQAIQQQQQASVTLASINDGVIRVNPQLEVEYLNPVAARLLGIQKDNAIGKSIDSIFEIFHEFSRVTAANPAAKCLHYKSDIKAEQKVILLDRSGNEYLIEHSAAPIRDKQGSIQGAVIVFRDFTETNKMKRKLDYQSQHDALTGLYNREVLDRSLKSALEETGYNDTSHCLLHINLHHFRLINESCGHDAGDQVLYDVGQLILHCIRETSDTLARVRGNEFGVLLRHCPISSAGKVADKILQAISTYKFAHHGQHYQISSNIGIACIDQPEVAIQEISACAETACQIAQEQGINNIQIFNVEDTEQAKRLDVMRLVTQLIKAEKNDQFELYCQAITPVRGDSHPSYELLLRMHTDNNDLISPGLFLSAAERYHLMPSIDRWVLRNAFDFFAHNPTLLEQVEHFTINLSGQSLIDDSCFEYIEQLFQLHTLDANKICFEITETAAISNYNRAASFIYKVREKGCKFSLDDFGSGMSSFAYLKELPVDFLKIDGLFVKNIANDEIDKAMVASINDIGHVMKLKTVAEFVEDQDALNILEQLGVDYAQGYHLCRPFPLIDLTQDLLNSSNKACL